MLRPYLALGQVDLMTMTPDAPTDTSARPQTPAIELYDFRRPTTLAREHSRVLEVVFETFSRQWGTQLTARVRVKSHVVSGSVLMQIYDEYAAGLPPTTAMVLCSLEGSDSKAVFQFPMSSALSWIGRMLGGNGLQAAPDRKFSQIEQSLVKQLMNDALEDLRYSLGSRFSIPIAIDSIQYNSQFAQAAATSDLMIVANFVITVGEDVAAATLVIPSEVLLEQMGAANPTGGI